jgi:hypothetical protein
MLACLRAGRWAGVPGAAAWLPRLELGVRFFAAVAGNGEKAPLVQLPFRFASALFQVGVIE